MPSILNRIASTAGDFIRSIASGPLMQNIPFTITGVSGNVQLTDPYSQHPIVYACIKVIADNIAGVPVYIVKNENAAPGEGRKRYNAERLVTRDGQMFARSVDGVEVVSSGPTVDLFTRPNPLQSSQQFWSSVVSYLSYEGECDIVCEEREALDDLPSAMVPTNPWAFTPRPDNSVIPEYWEYRERTRASRVLAPHELIRPRFFNPRDIRRGLSPLHVLNLTLNEDWAARVYNKSFFENGCTLSGFMTADGMVKKEQREEWMRGFRSEHQGAHNANKWALLSGVKDITPISASPRDVEFSNLMAMTKEEVAMVYRIPMVLLSRTQGINYATDKAERRGFWTTTLIPIIRNIEDVFWSDLFQYVEGGRYWLAFDLSSVEDLQEDLSTKFDTARKLFDMYVPLKDVNERLGLALPEVPGWDVSLAPMNLMPVTAMTGGDVVYTESGDQKVELAKPEPPKPDRLLVGPEIHRAADWQVWRRKFELVKREYSIAFAKKYKRYIFEYRKAMLANLQNIPRAAEWEEILFESEHVWNKRMLDMLIPILEESYVAGGDVTARELGVKPFVTATSPKAVAAMRARDQIIVGTSNNMRDRLRRSLAEGLTKGETTSELQQRVKAIMNAQESRALMIAHTETGSVMSTARFDEMVGDGVEYHSWSTAGSFATPPPREHHLEAEAEGPIKVGEIFNGTGCRYPLDPAGPPGEVINCRCCAIPEVEI